VLVVSKLSETEIKRIIEIDECFEMRGNGSSLYLSYREYFTNPTWIYRFKQDKLSLEH